nr:MAG TPA: secretion system protein [Caudoviricetes sp.]
MTKTYRPGVYSQYDVISQRKSLQDRYAFYCGAAKVQSGKNLPAGGVVQIHSREELEEYFDPQGGAMFCTVCGILLDSGVSGVYVVPLTIDGTQATEELYEPAIQKLCEIKRSGVILCDSGSQQVLEKLVEQVQLASQNERERLAVGAVAKTQAETLAKALNCERLVLCCQLGSDGEQESEMLTAAALAAMLVGSEPMDNLHGKQLDCLHSVESLSEQQVETLLGSGVTVMEELDGVVSCIRCVTSRTSTAGEEDRTFASVNVVMMIDDIIRSVRERLAGLLKGSTILFSQDSVASQAAVVLDEKQQEGMITSYEPPVVYVEPDDPAVCVVELEFYLASVFSQIYLTAHISI